MSSQGIAFYIVSAQINPGDGDYQGYITTYFITVNGTPLHDKAFTWVIREVENNQPLLYLVYQGDLDSDDIWDGFYPFKVVKLTDNYMWWQFNTNGNNSMIQFRRRSDINLE